MLSVNTMKSGLHVMKSYAGYRFTAMHGAITFGLYILQYRMRVRDFSTKYYITTSPVISKSVPCTGWSRNKKKLLAKLGDTLSHILSCSLKHGVGNTIDSTRLDCDNVRVNYRLKLQ